jgi:hypothetical protein
MTTNQVSFSDNEIEAPGYKYKCSVHKHYTNDLVTHQKHLMDKNLSHIEIVNNSTCFYCGERLDAAAEEGIQSRHYFTGKGTHKKCRDAMYKDIIHAK